MMGDDSPKPWSKVNHGQHNPSIIGEIGLPCVPQTEVADDEGALLDDGLRWRSFVSALL